MSLPKIPSATDLSLQEDSNYSHKLSMFKHIKKKAANDAQLLM